MISVLVVTHKKYVIPEDRGVYRPIFVGNKEDVPSGCLRDDTGDNIADKNASYCELTAMYWAWKNLKCDVIGINHYRRYMSILRDGKSLNDILTKEEIEERLKRYDVIVPRKRKIFLTDVRGHWNSHHYPEDLKKVGRIIKEKYPEYSRSFDEAMRSRAMHVCNMMIMNKKLFDDYCKWLFGVLFEAEKQIDISNYSVTQKRVFGFLGERLFDVWLDVNKPKLYEVEMVELEPEKFSVAKELDKVKRHLLRRKL